MSGATSLLIELGTEELPPKALPELAQCFFDGVVTGLQKRGVSVDAANGKVLYAPRRLAVYLKHVPAQQPTQKSEVLGPYLNIGLDASGQPTPALKGFAQKNGLDVSQLERTSDNKGERFVARSEKPGAATASLLGEIVNESLAALPVPKPMRWGSREIKFVRPVHWLVMLLGDNIVDAEVLGLKAGRHSRGHRFHHDQAVEITTPESYIDTLRSAYVLVDPNERREKIRAEIQRAADDADGTARVTEDLLEEVNCLVEWPRAILCGFEPSFLRVPQEALISTMEANQKFFSVLNHEHRITERFIGIANIESKNEAEVRKGYERVIRPRFADAQFFFNEDRKQGLSAMAQGLKSVTYQTKLGSYADKTARVAALAETIAAEVGVDPAAARRAAELSKADLQSRMVNEFPELQGIAGRYYASAQGETGEVADAIDQAYMPRFAADDIAHSKLGQVLAIAERLDTLVGGFAAGLQPTGNKDPFALRRNALGLARTIIEGEIDIDFWSLLHKAYDEAQFAIATQEAIRVDDATKKARSEGVNVEKGMMRISGQYNAQSIIVIRDFVIDRLRSYYADQDFSGTQFDAVASMIDNADVAETQVATSLTHELSLLDFHQRLYAVREFAKLPQAQSLAAANKRIRNILKKAESEIPAEVNALLLSEDAEKQLQRALQSALHDTEADLHKRHYVAVLTRLSQLRESVDTFFDKVMVNVDDANVRNNRLALLKQLADRFAAVADISQLSV
jgi:glycyl-tRNA synthetase beta chain